MELKKKISYANGMLFVFAFTAVRITRSKLYLECPPEPHHNFRVQFFFLVQQH